MEKWAEIRRWVKVEKRSKRSVCHQFGIRWDTLAKILEHPEPPGYRQARPRAKRKIGPFLGVIDEILAGDKTVHRKQHHTARRIFDRLKDEYGYAGGFTAVKEVVRVRRLRQWEVFMPLAHRPAEAQVDLGVADVIWEGHQRRVALPGATLGHHVMALTAWFHYGLGITVYRIVDIFGYANPRPPVHKKVGRVGLDPPS